MPTDGALFALPHARGPSEKAMRRSIRQWKTAGRAVDPSMASDLLTQAHAVDLARDRRDPWQISNAIRQMTECKIGYGLIERAVADDPFEALLRGIADDDSTAAGADVPGAEIRDTA